MKIQEKKELLQLIETVRNLQEKIIFHLKMKRMY